MITQPSATPTTRRERVPLRALKRHPAHDRSIYDRDKLIELTLQIMVRGINDWSLIVAAPSDEGSYHIISGRRRYLAYMLGRAVIQWLEGQEEQSADDLQLTADTINFFLDQEHINGDPELAVSELKELYGDEEVEIVVFMGDEQAQILALQADNQGREQPDLMGLARSYAYAIESGIPPSTIAKNSGKKESWVMQVATLTLLPPVIANAITTGDLSLNAAEMVAVLSDDQKEAVAQFVAGGHQAGNKVTLQQITTMSKAFRAGPPSMPLLITKQTVRNIARILLRVWNEAVAQNPVMAWRDFGHLALNGNHVAPWEESKKASAWLSAFRPEFVIDGRVNWGKASELLVGIVSCDTCPIKNLPPTKLKQDLIGAGTMACRQNKPLSPCLSGYAAGDGCRVLVPASWEGHPGVSEEGNHLIITDWEVLPKAWEAQYEAEQEPAESADPMAEIREVAQAINEAHPMADGSERVVIATATPVTTAPTPAKQTAGTPNSAESKPSAPKSSEPGSADKGQKPAKHLPLQTFVADHSKLNTAHPFATACQGCQHRQEGANPCSAKSGQFYRIGLTNGAIPVCGQYTPNKEWKEIIPEHPGSQPFERNWALEQMTMLVKAMCQKHASAIQSGRTPAPLAFLMPFKRAKTNYAEETATRFLTLASELSAAKLTTLVTWVIDEFGRFENPDRFRLPGKGGAVEYGAIKEWAE